ncbi:FAD-dependent monooxygenase [Streptomyces geranii]|uniref:FAD-dependent monooxygenase n=1 Tax=Streptomyces geranii TaxID=2058923 RepID=UPI000D1CD769
MSGGPVTFLFAEGQVDRDCSRTSAHHVLGRSGSVVFVPRPGVITFGSQERIATDLCLGRLLLVGDAAQTRSPVGGQGLDLGATRTGARFSSGLGSFGRRGPRGLERFVVRRHAVLPVRLSDGRAGEPYGGGTGNVRRMSSSGPGRWGDGTPGIRISTGDSRPPSPTESGTHDREPAGRTHRDGPVVR